MFHVFFILFILFCSLNCNISGYQRNRDVSMILRYINFRYLSIYLKRVAVVVNNYNINLFIVYYYCTSRQLRLVNFSSVVKLLSVSILFLHLGHVITSSLSDKEDIMYRRNCFINQANNVLCFFSKLSGCVRTKLFKAYVLTTVIAGMVVSYGP